jgi:type VI secretion system protein ImpC
MADEPEGDEQEGSLLQQMLEDASAQARRAPPPKKAAADPLSSLLESLPSRPTGTNKLTPERLVADIDALIASVVDPILAQPEVQRLRLAWQGLKELADQVDFDENVLVEFLSCSKQELADDFEAASSVTASGLYRRLCDRELAPKGKPYSPISLMLADFEFESHQHEIELLSTCAAAAADGHAVFIANASARFFGCEDFSDLASQGDLGRLLEGPRYAAWQSFRNSDDARYVALCVPAVARAFAIQVAASFAESGGFEALAGEASHAAEGLTLAGDAEYDLSDGGLVTLVGAEGLGSRFGSTHSAYRPPRFADTEEGRAAATDARGASKLTNILSASRLAHFVEAVATELLPGIDARELEQSLQKWLSDSTGGASSLGAAQVAIVDAGYLRYELVVQRPEGGGICNLPVAGRLD